RDRIIFLELNGDFADYGYGYYFDLLALRRLVGREVWQEVRTRNPGATVADFNAECQKRYGERGLRVAKEVLRKGDSPTFLADEQLTVLAVLTAVLTGHHAVLLTRDLAVQEQFFKLFQLLVDDYCG